MKNLSVHIVAPFKLQGLCTELGVINNYCNEQVHIKVSGYDADIKSFEATIEKEGVADWDCLLLFDVTEDAINAEKAYVRLLRTIKTVRLREPVMKIVVALGKEKETDIPLINELIKIGVFDLHFVEDFSLDDIADWIFGKLKTLQDVEQFISQSIYPQKEIVEKIIEVPVEVLVKAPQGAGKKSKRLAFFGKNRTEKMKAEPVRKETQLIGILGAGYGVGVTSLAVRLAGDFASIPKKKVALLERNESQQLQRWVGRESALKSVDFYDDVPFHSLPWREYDYVIIDYGVYLELSAGAEYVAKVIDDESKTRRTELSFCSKVILMGNAAPWRVLEWQFYIRDIAMKNMTQEWIFYIPGGCNCSCQSDEVRHFIDGEPGTAYEELKKYIVEEI